jgi:8-amino-7-oxononanoate synthase
MHEKKIRERLLLQKQAGLYRDPPEVSRRVGKYVYVGNNKLLSFASNDYLGLASDREVRKKVAANFAALGTSSSSSRLVSGNYRTIAEAEKAYARYFGFDQALFFPSGYQANIGLISGLFDQGDAIIFDKHIHASSVKGIGMSGARFFGYNHNNMQHLAKRLEAQSGNRTTVLTEALFSMDGDLIDIDGIAELKKRHHFLTIVDEAHSFGAIGPGGRGVARDVADVSVGTFGKAFGFFGAFILMPDGFKEYLFNFSSPLIYSTTLPEAHAASALDILEIVAQSDKRRRKLGQISRFMKERLQGEGFTVYGDAHILAVEIGDEDLAVAVSKKMRELGVFAFPARFPTVPLHKAILRVSMTAQHTARDVGHFINMLKEAIHHCMK